MRKLSLIILLVHSTSSLFSQDLLIQPDPADVQLISRSIDSLKLLVKTNKIVAYNNACNFPGHKITYFVSPELNFSEQALALTEKKSQTYIHSYALHLKAIHLYQGKEYEAANRIWEQLIELAEEKNFHFEELHMFRKALNNNYFLAGKYVEAMKISIAGYQRAEKLGDTTMVAHFANVLGYIHMKQGNLPEAGRYFSEYRELSRQINDTSAEAHALYNLGEMYLEKNIPDSAIQFLEASINLYRAGMGNPDKKFNIVEREGYVANKIAQAWILKGDYAKALSFIRTSLESIRFYGVNAYDKAEYYIRAGEIYNHLKQPDSAFYLSKVGLSIARQIIHQEHMMGAYEQLAIAFANKKQYDSAWSYHQLFQLLNDTINNESSKRDILLREANLNIEKEKARQEVVLERQRLWRNIIIGLAAFMMIITYLLYNRYRLKQKNRLQAELNRQQLEILRTTIEVQDKERKRIAEDLHDSLGSILSAAKLKLSALDERGSQNGNGENVYMDDTLSLLDEAINEMKNIAYNIMPATLSRLGLIAALQNLFNRIGHRSGLKINFSTHGFEERLDPMLEMSIYRIVLESINNVVKHAHAQHVTVQLIKYPDYLNITIEDDGIGFRQTLEFHGNGLANIDSRVRNLGGSLDIDSVEGRGTTILVDIPFREG